MLRAVSLSKIIQTRVLLDNIDLVLRPGQIVSVVGPSGSGKTTLLKAMSLIESASSGHVAIDGDSYRFPLSGTVFPNPYPKVTVVFQQLFIWPHLTIRENLVLPLRGQLDIAYFDGLTQGFEMTEFLDRYPNQVSIGQRQRTALVRSLLLRPRYLFLDEVTSALDVEQTQLILKHLRDIADQGVGILMVTHGLHWVAQLSDWVVFMEDGRLVEQGSPDILIHPKTQRLFQFISSQNGWRC